MCKANTRRHSKCAEAFTTYLNSEFINDIYQHDFNISQVFHNRESLIYAGRSPSFLYCIIYTFIRNPAYI